MTAPTTSRITGTERALSVSQGEGDAAGAPLVVGLDLSLTGTGIAHLRGDQLVTELLAAPSSRTGEARLRWITRTVLDLCRGADLVVVEGPSYGSSGAGSHDRAGLWHMVKTDGLWRRGIYSAAPSPSSLKKYALGVGSGKRATKDHVLAACVRAFPTFDGENNQADATWLAAMGADWLTGVPVVAAVHREALAAVKWPDVGAVAR